MHIHQQFVAIPTNTNGGPKGPLQVKEIRMNKKLILTRQIFESQ